MPRFARLIIETSGLTGPGPPLQTFAVGCDFYLRGLVTIVDCRRCRQHRSNAAGIRTGQVFFASKGSLESLPPSVKAGSPWVPAFTGTAALISSRGSQRKPAGWGTRIRT
ncbi:MAG: hypothetical protein JO081_11405 [Alphaproteobacteria bacterium]|nr:hypothetical protein [Alphaproteobacteria bacterium]